MKIEKINDNQFKCTLNKSDLATRKIKLSELAYGTDKAKELFSDMMQLAASEVGFVAEDIPLMIEAIPVSSECIILVVTKVDDPEELDTRFSQFSPYSEDFEYDDDLLPNVDTTDNVLDIFNASQNSSSNKEHEFTPLVDTIKGESNNADSNSDSVNKEIIQIFSFNNIDLVSDVGRLLSEKYDGENTLYKIPNDPLYYLVIHSSGLSLKTFNNICNMISEYATCVKTGTLDEAYYNEHGSILCSKKALQKLSTI